MGERSREEVQPESSAKKRRMPDLVADEAGRKPISRGLPQQLVDNLYQRRRITRFGNEGTAVGGLPCGRHQDANLGAGGLDPSGQRIAVHVAWQLHVCEDERDLSGIQKVNGVVRRASVKCGER
jgi:hypothetical protein